MAHPCPHCTRTFKHPRNLGRHVSTTHGSKQPKVERKKPQSRTQTLAQRAAHAIAARGLDMLVNGSVEDTYNTTLTGMQGLFEVIKRLTTENADLRRERDRLAELLGKIQGFTNSLDKEKNLVKEKLVA